LRMACGIGGPARPFETLRDGAGSIHARTAGAAPLNPERIVLITQRDPQLMAEAWEAGIVSVVSEQDPISTVLLAIMAAGLRVEKPHIDSSPSGISPTAGTVHAPLPPEPRNPGSKRCKTQ